MSKSKNTTKPSYDVRWSNELQSYIVKTDAYPMIATTGDTPRAALEEMENLVSIIQEDHARRNTKAVQPPRGLEL